MLKSLIVLIVLNVCLAANACTELGKTVELYAGAPGCCKGLEVKAGSCVRKTCVEEGNSVGVYPRAPSCCEGLELKMAPTGAYGSAGTCVAKAVEEELKTK